MKDRLKKMFSISPLKITLFVILLALVLFFLDVPFLRFMELKALDLRMLSRGKIPSGGETVIAVIDEKSLAELGRWPWPRTTIAKLVDTLKAYGAKAIGFDIVFAEPDENSSLKTIDELTQESRKIGLTDKRLQALLGEKKAMADNDAILAKAIEKAKNVTLGYFFHISKKEVAHLTEKDIEATVENISGSKYSMTKEAENVNEAAIVHAYAAAPNLKQLSEAAENSGYFNAFPDSDGAIRWAPLVIKFRDTYYSSLALSLLIQYWNWPMVVLNLDEFGVECIKI